MNFMLNHVFSQELYWIMEIGMAGI